MEHNRMLQISTAGNRKATHWPKSEILWSDFTDKLKTPVRGMETLDQYLALPKSRQDELKDVGGFVGGTFTGDRRKAACVEGRDLVTLDLDNIAAGQTDDILKRVGGLGCAAAVYSTRKHAGYAPRLRVIIPLDRTATADEYEPAARKLAFLIGIGFCDPTTFEASRLMYWPSCCADSQYVHAVFDGAFCSLDRDPGRLRGLEGHKPVAAGAGRGFRRQKTPGQAGGSHGQTGCDRRVLPHIQRHTGHGTLYTGDV